MLGQRIRLSVPRRFVTDIMRYAAAVPGVPAERIMDLSAVIAARNAVPYRPPWVGIFAKALALTAQDMPQLRRAFVKWPWPHLYEYPVSVAAITIQRDYHGEPFVFPKLLKDPVIWPMDRLAKEVHRVVDAPVAEVLEFKRAIRISRLPGILRRPLIWWAYNSARQRATRFGTFTVTAVSFTGTDLKYVPTLTTSLLTFGTFGDDGRTAVRMVVDHRVMDGMAFAAVLARLEDMLNGPILQELRAHAAVRATSSCGTPAAS